MENTMHGAAPLRETRFHADKGNDPTKFYTKGEEIMSAVTHGIGSLCGVVGTTVLVTLAALRAGTGAVVISLIYGLSLILLYTMSTLYHALPQTGAKKTLRVFDHTTIFLLIAGSYTPLALVPLRGTWKGYVLCGAVWALALLGIVLNCISIKRFAAFSMILYVAMGWAVVFALGDIMHALPAPAFWLLLAGGLCYTGGIAFYGCNRVRYLHGVWHLCVLAGSVLHYICIACYVMPMMYVR
ncbi:MAG: hemolysin III family protein [Ruthenibacterium sp.]